MPPMTKHVHALTHLQCISQGLTRLGFRESSPYEAMLKGHWPKHHMHMLNA